MSHRWQAALVLALVAGGCTAVLPPALYPLPASGTGGGPSYAKEVVPILRAHCAKCHVPGNPGPALFEADGTSRYDETRNRLDDLVRSIKKKQMPPAPAVALSDEERAILEAWQRAGAPGP